jgi:hypothetical protein
VKKKKKKKKKKKEGSESFDSWGVYRSIHHGGNQLILPVKEERANSSLNRSESFQILCEYATSSKLRPFMAEGDSYGPYLCGGEDGEASQLV